MYDAKFYEWTKLEGKTFKSKEFLKNELGRGSDLPVSPGCYIWKVDNEIVYIGRTSNLKNRLGSHLFANVSGKRSNAIYTTTARDTLMKHFLPHQDHERFRDLERKSKQDNEEFMELWEKLQKIIEKRSSFMIYSTKTIGDSMNLERELVEELRPATNNVLPNRQKARDDKKILGFEA